MDGIQLSMWEGFSCLVRRSYWVVYIVDGLILLALLWERRRLRIVILYATLTGPTAISSFKIELVSQLESTVYSLRVEDNVSKEEKFICT